MKKYFVQKMEKIAPVEKILNQKIGLKNSKSENQYIKIGSCKKNR